MSFIKHILLSVNTVFCVCQILYGRIRTGGAAGFCQNHRICMLLNSCDLLLQSHWGVCRKTVGKPFIVHQNCQKLNALQPTHVALWKQHFTADLACRKQLHVLVLCRVGLVLLRYLNCCIALQGRQVEYSPVLCPTSNCALKAKSNKLK